MNFARYLKSCWFVLFLSSHYFFFFLAAFMLSTRLG
jgi:hypothetical protein